MAEPEDVHTVDTDRPPNPLDDLLSLLDAGTELVREMRDSGDGRPPELWVRWRVVGGVVEILSCTVSRLDEEELDDGDYESRYR